MYNNACKHIIYTLIPLFYKWTNTHGTVLRGYIIICLDTHLEGRGNLIDSMSPPSSSFMKFKQLHVSHINVNSVIIFYPMHFWTTSYACMYNAPALLILWCIDINFYVCVSSCSHDIIIIQCMHISHFAHGDHMHSGSSNLFTCWCMCWQVVGFLFHSVTTPQWDHW